jgi:hypothetical protein
MDSVEDARGSLTTLPYLTVLLSRRPESNRQEPCSRQELVRIGGRGFLTQSDVVITAAHVGKDANTAVVLGESVNGKKHIIQAFPRLAQHSFGLSVHWGPGIPPPRCAAA